MTKKNWFGQKNYLNWIKFNLARYRANFKCQIYFQTDVAQSSDSKENKNENSKPQDQATTKPDVDQEKSPVQKDGKKEGSESPEEDRDIIVDYTDEETVKTLCSQVSLQFFVTEGYKMILKRKKSPGWFL